MNNTIGLSTAFQPLSSTFERIANPRMVPLAWVRTAVEEQEALLGGDPWGYGLTAANRKNLQTVQSYCRQQGLISRMLPLEELFADTDLGDAGGIALQVGLIPAEAKAGEASI